MRPAVQPGFAPGAILLRAELAQSAGDHIAAGVLLREAVRQRLYVIAEQNGVLRAHDRFHRSPTVLANPLLRAGILDQAVFLELRQMIYVGNAAAHCEPIDPAALRTAIETLRAHIAATPGVTMTTDHQP